MYLSILVQTSCICINTYVKKAQLVFVCLCFVYIFLLDPNDMLESSAAYMRCNHMFVWTKAHFPAAYSACNKYLHVSVCVLFV
jgi:hypothetical protein